VSTTLEPIKSTNRTEVTPIKSETTDDIINRFAAQENLSEKYILRGKELVN
jgi:hypothetical protein